MQSSNQSSRDLGSPLGAAKETTGVGSLKPCTRSHKVTYTAACQVAGSSEHECYGAERSYLTLSAEEHGSGIQGASSRAQASHRKFSVT